MQHSSKLPAIFSVLLLVAAVPVTVFLVQQQQVLENHAAEQKAIHTQSVAPEIEISAPTNGARIHDGDSINVAIVNDVQVAGVEFYVNNQQVATKTAPPFIQPIAVSSLPSGNIKITVRAYDASGNVSSKSITVVK